MAIDHKDVMLRSRFVLAALHHVALVQLLRICNSRGAGGQNPGSRARRCPRAYFLQIREDHTQKPTMRKIGVDLSIFWEYTFGEGWNRTRGWVCANDGRVGGEGVC